MLLPLLALALQDPAWAVLTLPDLCREAPPPPPWPSLPDGSHLLLEDDRPRVAFPRLAPLPIATLLELLEGDARERDVALEVRRPSPPVLVRGAEPAVTAARQLARDLAAAAAEREIELELWLAPVLARSRDAAPPATAPLHETTLVRSGGAALLGTREVRSFVSGYDVEVATGSGAADPAPGLALSGRAVHLVAWRVSGGREVLLAGVLDLVDPAAIERVELSAGDVGEFERPLLPVCQIVFGGRVENGGRLRVTVSGAPLAEPDWTLWVEARAREDGARAWRCADLALLDAEVQALPLPSPGAGLEELLSASAERTIAPATPASSIWGAVETRLRAAGSRSPRPLLAFSPGLLIARADEADVWAEVQTLAAALEGERGRTRELSIQDGGLTVTMPVAAGLPARVLVGEESTVVIDFDAEIATETWMGVPRVARSFDGTCLQGRLEGETFTARWWRARSFAEPTAPIDTTHGLLRARSRSLAAGQVLARTGLAPESAGMAPTLRLSAP